MSTVCVSSMLWAGLKLCASSLNHMASMFLHTLRDTDTAAKVKMLLQSNFTQVDRTLTIRMSHGCHHVPVILGEAVSGSMHVACVYVCLSVCAIC